MHTPFQRALGIGIIVVGLLLFSGIGFAQATPTLVCGEKQTLNAITGNFIGLINVKGIAGTATVGGVPNIITMTNAHFEDATFSTPNYGAPNGVELGCKLQNANGVSLTNTSGTSLLRLSSSTNAHAETISTLVVNYPTIIKLGTSSGTITMNEVAGTQSCAATQTELVRLYATTNSHGESPHHTPANYNLATSVRICLSYSNVSGGTTPTDLIVSQATISTIPGNLGTSTPISYSVGTTPAVTPVYVNSLTTKASAIASATQTRSEGFLILCVAGDTDCDAINSLDATNVANLNTFNPGSLGYILTNATTPILILAQPFNSDPAAQSLLNFISSNPTYVTKVVLSPPPYNDLENQTFQGQPTPGIGIVTIPGTPINSILDTGSYAGVNAFPNIPALASGSGYTMRVIAFSFPGTTIFNGTNYNETNPGFDTGDNKSTTTINVTPSGTPGTTIQDIVQNQINTANFTTGQSYVFGSYPTPAPVVGVVTKVINGLFATNVQTVTVVAVCQLNDNTPFSLPGFTFTTRGGACGAVNDAYTLIAALQSANIDNVIFPAFRKIYYWGGNFPTSSNFNQMWSPATSTCSGMGPGTGPYFTANTWNSCPNPPAPAALSSGPPAFGVAYDAYSPPAGTPVGTWRVVMATFPTTADVGGNSASETIPTIGNLVPVDMANNFASTTFSVQPAGTTLTTCNNNNVCEPWLGEDPITCPADCPISTPGDVYVMKDISLPQRYKGEQVDVSLTIQSKKAIPTSTNVEVLVKDKDGRTLAGYPYTQTVSFSGTLVGGVENLTVNPIVLETAATPPNITFKAGETYTLYAKVAPYNDPATTGFDESVLANNSAFKTFTVPEAPQTFSIPDQPWWMGLVVVMGLLGWMFVASRKNESTNP